MFFPAKFAPVFPTIEWNETVDQFFGRDRLYSNESFPITEQWVEQDENKKTLIIRLALAGYKKELLSVNIIGNRLIITADKADHPNKTLKSKIACRAFKNEFIDTENVWNLEQSDVNFIDGMLTLSIPEKKQDEGKKLLVK